MSNLPPNENDDKITHPSGATSSFVYDFAQIPLGALKSIAKRFMLGEKKHGRGNWRKGLGNESYTIERLNHIIFHCYKLINKIEGNLQADGDDDAGAIAWGGCFAVEAVAALEAKGHHLINPVEPVAFMTESSKGVAAEEAPRAAYPARPFPYDMDKTVPKE